MDKAGLFFNPNLKQLSFIWKLRKFLRLEFLVHTDALRRQVSKMITDIRYLSLLMSKNQLHFNKT